MITYVPGITEQNNEITGAKIVAHHVAYLWNPEIGNLQVSLETVIANFSK